LKKNYFITSLSNIVDHLQTKRVLPKKAIAITFDDGHADTFLNAFPVLNKYQVPATVYLATGAIDRQEPIWTELVDEMICRAGQPLLSFQCAGEKFSYSLKSMSEKLEAAKAIKTTMKGLDDSKRVDILDKLRGLTLYEEKETGNPVMITWEQARLMCANGFEFGAHTVNHPILSRISGEQARAEIADSKARIEEMLGARVRHFAYPNGEVADFNESHKRMLVEAGFDTACTTSYGVNSNQDDRFALSRVYVTNESVFKLGMRLLRLEI
jgi:peptidoglycan/xylan/chitin deacetylase (PgdA/CDA1 family)